MLSGIRPAMPRKMQQSVNIRLSDALVEQIDAMRAARRDLPSRQAIGCEAVEAYLEQGAAPVAMVMAKRKAARGERGR